MRSCATAARRIPSTCASCCAARRSGGRARPRTSLLRWCSSRATVPHGPRGRSSRSPAEVTAAGRTCLSAASCAELTTASPDLVEVLPREAAPPGLHLADEVEHRAVQRPRHATARRLADQPSELRLGLGLSLPYREVDPNAGALLQRIERAGDRPERAARPRGRTPLGPERFRIEPRELE